MESMINQNTVSLVVTASDNVSLKETDFTIIILLMDIGIIWEGAVLKKIQVLLSGIFLPVFQGRL